MILRPTDITVKGSWENASVREFMHAPAISLHLGHFELESVTNNTYLRSCAFKTLTSDMGLGMYSVVETKGADVDALSIRTSKSTSCFRTSDSEYLMARTTYIYIHTHRRV